MARNVFAFIGLWVVVATAQDIVRRCRTGWASAD